MSPVLTFFAGLSLLVLFARYLLTDRPRTKRLLGTVLTVVIVALSLAALNPPDKTIRLGLDLRGGTSFLIRLVPEGDEPIQPDTLDRAVEVIRGRIDHFGGKEPVITPRGTDRILVQVPGLDPKQIEEARQQLSRVAKLEFRLVHPRSDALVPAIESGSVPVPAGYRIETYAESRNGATAHTKLLVKQRPEILGNRVSKASASFEQQGWGIALEFDPAGAELFGRLTADHVGDRFAIVLDGIIQSAPVIKEAIHGGRASIAGNFDEKEARNLAGVLENPLQTPVRIEEQRSVSATLGTDSIRTSIIAGVVGLVASFLAVLAYYRFAGLVANVALAINLILLFGAMAVFGLVLTLPGIAGIILTIGMAVDANVLIYERLREEIGAGKPLKAAIGAAYDKAFSAIFDSNVTTLITAVILFWKATGPVQGFAVTLSIGIVASMFSALLVTRTCFAWVVERDTITRLRMANWIKPGGFDFLAKRRVAAFVSISILAVCAITFGMRCEKNFGVDFTGGDLLVLQSKNSLSEGTVRERLDAIGMGESVVQTERTAEKEFLTIRSEPNTGDVIAEHLIKTLPNAGISVVQSDKVGSQVGGELAWNSLVALGFGMVGIFLYVAGRFEWSFAAAAIIALLHDVLITVGAFALLGRELSLIVVGAVLTIAGYSINDTIVIFDRIRENLAKGGERTGAALAEIMNRSINETLSRTLLTSGTTILCTLALYLWGGPVLHDFAFAILVGILVGTYSSIFVASPLVWWWSRGKGASHDPGKRELDGIDAFRESGTLPMYKTGPGTP
jgi:SecD/SecF fusion protein